MDASDEAVVGPLLFLVEDALDPGADEFVFFYAMPGDASHDYEAFEAKGFRDLVVERSGAPVVIPKHASAEPGTGTKPTRALHPARLTCPCPSVERSSP